jgi:hypothetical protein
MNTKFKVLKLSGGNYLIAIAGGEIDGDGLARIFREVSELSLSLLNCKVLIDLEAARLRLQAADMDALFHALRPELGPQKSKSPSCLRQKSTSPTGYSCWQTHYAAQA